VQSSALLKSRQFDGNIPLAKRELGTHVRPQAGAWEREQNERQGAFNHLTLTTDPWQLITV
jgi:hypothetical protein